MDIPDQPENSQIQINSEPDCLTLSWKKPGGGTMRLFIAAFLLFWLCGWAVGFVAAIANLVAGDEPPSPFLVVWLAFWTIGGAFAVGFLYLLLRPQKPESVTLWQNRFEYDTGSATLNFFNPYWMMKKKYVNPFSMLFQRRKTYEFSRGECPEFVLEGMGDNQRLRFDDGADRVQIGESLKEPEREWLAEVLSAWRKG